MRDGMPSVSSPPNLAGLARSAFAPVREAVDAHRIPGAVFGIVDAAGAKAVDVVGLAQIVPDRFAMSLATWFDLSSLTKVIFTTTNILRLVEAGIIALDDPLTNAIPDLRQYDPGALE